MSDPSVPQGKAAIWFSVTAFAVSILSFIAVSGQTWLMYEHNRMSVMPKLDWRVSYGEGAKPRLQIDLVNAGLGPAKVSDIQLVVNGQAYPLTNGAACAAIDTVLDVDPELYKGSDCFAIDADDWAFVRAGERLPLYVLGVDTPAGTVDFDPLEALGVTAQYCSLYDQCAPL